MLDDHRSTTCRFYHRTGKRSKLANVFVVAAFRALDLFRFPSILMVSVRGSSGTLVVPGSLYAERSQMPSPMSDRVVRVGALLGALSCPERGHVLLVGHRDPRYVFHRLSVRLTVPG